MNRPVYVKALAALLGAVGTWGVTALEDDRVAGSEWAGLLIALGTALAVYGVKNGESADLTTSTPQE